MATVIRQVKKEGQRLPEQFYELFPPELIFALEGLIRDGVPLDEIRLRTGRRAFVSSGMRNIPLGVVLGRAQIDSIVDILCDGSLYAHADTVNRGYITSYGGMRVGIVGRAAVEDNRIIGVYDVSSLCFRLPRRIYRVGAPVCSLIREGVGGVLIYSPPAHGKTTLLRSVCHALASGSTPLRIAVIDTRGELGFSLEGEELCVDMLTGYPRSPGLEIAARSMNAQLAVCDEIGGDEEAQSIIGVQNCGVPLLATAHAGSLKMLLRREGFAKLHRARVFGAYVGIERRENAADYIYTVNTWEEANEYFENGGGCFDCV